MFLMFLFLFLIMSPEVLVTTIVGGIIALVGTQFFKAVSGMQGVGAMVLAIVVSFVVAIASVAISTVVSGNQFSVEILPAAALQIFALATIAYKLLTAEVSSRGEEQ